MFQSSARKPKATSQRLGNLRETPAALSDIIEMAKRATGAAATRKSTRAKAAPKASEGAHAAAATSPAKASPAKKAATPKKAIAKKATPKKAGGRGKAAKEDAAAPDTLVADGELLKVVSERRRVHARRFGVGGLI
jgi:hypothetical protein